MIGVMLSMLMHLVPVSCWEKGRGVKSICILHFSKSVDCLFIGCVKQLSENNTD